MVDVKDYGFGDEIEFLHYENEEEWHKLRSEGIGGSDAGAVMGLNKYTSPLKLFRKKTGRYVEDTEDNVYIKKGKALESYVFEEHVRPDLEPLGFKVVHPEHVFINKQFPWLRANLDGLAVPDYSMSAEHHIVVEIKWVSEWAESNWNGDDYCGIPASYYAQVQHYMLVTGAPVAYLYALFDKNWEVKRYEIPFNTSFAVRLINETKEFHKALLTGNEPKIAATLDKEFISEALEKMPVKTEESEELTEIIAEYLALKADAKELEKKMDECYDKAVEMYLDGKRPTKLFSMCISESHRAGFDAKRFAAEHPAVYEQYKTDATFTRTVIKRR